MPLEECRAARPASRSRWSDFVPAPTTKRLCLTRQSYPEPLELWRFAREYDPAPDGFLGNDAPDAKILLACSRLLIGNDNIPSGAGAGKRRRRSNGAGTGRTGAAQNELADRDCARGETPARHLQP